eukprot:Nitzschia sp. Nitz4//scaffold120_size68122//52655//53743//NITZ4_006053-RA/size68122-processed-gene-0.52-mRNA-1//-1//CDS//3329534305//1788//frame0
MNSILPNDDRNVFQAQDFSFDGMNANSLFMNFNNAMLKQPNQPQQLPQPLQQSQRINPSFNLLQGQDMLGQSQLTMNLGLNPNMGMGANLEPNMALNFDGPLSSLSDEKRKLLSASDSYSKPLKKMKTEDPSQTTSDAGPTISMTLNLSDDAGGPAPVDASDEGIEFFRDNDVLSGRGGGTNVHPGNRNFRDLINTHRRAYLKARKNDKPAISRAIVRAIRESGGRFLKKKDKSNLWHEIGDDAAREKTSQALRQRAPEMRKLLFDTEREEARVVAEEQIRQQQQRMFMVGMNPSQVSSMMGSSTEGSSGNGMMNPALLQAMAVNSKLGNGQDGNGSNQQLSNMFSAALLQNGINRFASNGA